LREFTSALNLKGDVSFVFALAARLMAVEVTKRLWKMENVYCYAAGVEGNDADAKSWLPDGPRPKT
jgi:uncharacterized protein (DUF2384 family)